MAGHTGLVGSAIVRRLQKDGASNLLLQTSKTLDLRNQRAVERFFTEEKPEVVFLAAAKVGGIHANNTYPAEFIHDNLVIQSNIIHSAWKNGVSKLCFLGSSCIYPKHAPQPMREDHLLTGELEPTNEWYAIAKIAGVKMCQAYRRQYGFDAISLMPTNLYGPGDNFHPENSHVLPALIRRFHEAREQGAETVTIWGTGSPKREFLHVDDLADAAVYLTEHYSDEKFRQHRGRRRHQHHRAGAPHRRYRRLHRPDPNRPHPTRRHPQKTPRRQPRQRPGLASKNQTPPRHPDNLRVVQEKPLDQKIRTECPRLPPRFGAHCFPLNPLTP